MSRPSKHKGPDALDYLWEKYYANDPKARTSLDEIRVNALIASQIYSIRKQNKLTQKALADMVGTTTSVICQLEDADYEGHSLRMLRKIASALNRRILFAFLSEGEHVVIRKARKKKATKSPSLKANRRKSTEVVLE